MPEFKIEKTHEADLSVDIDVEEVREVIHDLLVKKMNRIKNSIPMWVDLPDVKVSDLVIVNYFKHASNSDRVTGSGMAVHGHFTIKL